MMREKGGRLELGMNEGVHVNSQFRETSELDSLVYPAVNCHIIKISSRQLLCFFPRRGNEQNGSKFKGI